MPACRFLMEVKEFFYYFKSSINLSSFYSFLTNLDNVDYCFNLRKFSGVVGEVGTNNFIFL